ncbi:MAG: FIST N-terminal domain-containing protein [Cyanobium sp.]
MTEPQSWVGVGASNLSVSADALAEALAELALTWTPRLLVVLAAPHHNLEAVARELALELPQTAVIGCTTAG